MNKPVVTREARVFYSMVALFKCGTSFAEYLLTTPDKAVHREIKADLRKVVNQVNNLQRQAIIDLDEKDKKQWLKDWERDFGVYSSVFEMLSDFNDDQRAAVEEFCEQMKAGNVQIIAA